MRKSGKTLVHLGAKFGAAEELLLEELYRAGLADDYELDFSPELLKPVQRAFDRIIALHGIRPINFWFTCEAGGLS